VQRLSFRGFPDHIRAYRPADSSAAQRVQIAVMHRILVDEKKWIVEERFRPRAQLLPCSLPGPEHKQLANLHRLAAHRTKASSSAGVLFVVPGFLAIMALSFFHYHSCPWLPRVSRASSFGRKAAVLASVLQAIVRSARGPSRRAR